ncbi:MAG TPA: class I SAM-dependent methyltransferase [Candidatus Saccharimonadaceae bacterium]|nr:class I SAM-dependent methyltransferase [Candidatus Saccharimonadaceae bacterium]
MTKYDNERRKSRELFGDRTHRLEIGHASVAAAVPGYDPRYFEAGTTVVTVDPFRDEFSKTMGNNTPHDDVSLHDGYSRESMVHRFRKAIVAHPDRVILPWYTHAPIRADGRKLPFSDDSFNEVLFTNVVSDPGIPEENIARMLSEALRVAGRVIVAQDNTADVAEERLDASNLAAQGLDVRTIKSGGMITAEDRRYYRALGIMDMDTQSVYIITRRDDYSPAAGVRIASHAKQLTWRMEQREKARLEQLKANRTAQLAARRARREELLGRLGLRR